MYGFKPFTFTEGDPCFKGNSIVLFFSYICTNKMLLYFRISIHAIHTCQVSWVYPQSLTFSIWFVFSFQILNVLKHYFHIHWLRAWQIHVVWQCHAKSCVTYVRSWVQSGYCIQHWSYAPVLWTKWQLPLLWCLTASKKPKRGFKVLTSWFSDPAEFEQVISKTHSRNTTTELYCLLCGPEEKLMHNLIMSKVILQVCVITM